MRRTVFSFLFAITMVASAAEAQGLFDRAACSRHLQISLRQDAAKADVQCICLEGALTNSLTVEERNLAARDLSQLTGAERARLEIVLLKVGAITEQAADSCNVPIEALRQPLQR